MSALAKGLLKNDLKKSLAKTYPKDFVRMLALAKKNTQMKRLSYWKKIHMLLHWEVGGKCRDVNSPQGMRGESSPAPNPYGRGIGSSKITNLEGPSSTISRKFYT